MKTLKESILSSTNTGSNITLRKTLHDLEKISFKPNLDKKEYEKLVIEILHCIGFKYNAQTMYINKNQVRELYSWYNLVDSKSYEICLSIYFYYTGYIVFNLRKNNFKSVAEFDNIYNRLLSFGFQIQSIKNKKEDGTIITFSLPK